jgi:alcohol/geraniol dehydrogenase (NADP+)
MSIHAYASRQQNQALEPYEYEAEALKAHEVEIRISHCGICYSDIHMIDNDWGTSTYPLIPGHEVIGVVNAMGSEVTHLKEGQRVGVGWQAGSCLQCEWCTSAQENLCPESVGTCVGRPGGFAEAIRVDSRFVFPIPLNMPSETAAPLLCAGVTVYSPLKRLGKTGNFRVGVIGIGGLGHLALQFANAMGYEVTAFSSSSDKEMEARELGAHHFVNSNEPQQMKSAARSIDLLLNTAYTELDWNEYLKVLRPNGTLCFLGAPGKLEVPVNALLFGQKAVTASVIGSRSTMMEMLEFASRNGIKAKTEIMPMDKVNEAIEKVRNNNVRYRMVLMNV